MNILTFFEEESFEEVLRDLVHSNHYEESYNYLTSQNYHIGTSKSFEHQLMLDILLNAVKEAIATDPNYYNVTSGEISWAFRPQWWNPDLQHYLNMGFSSAKIVAGIRGSQYFHDQIVELVCEILKDMFDIYLDVSVEITAMDAPDDNLLTVTFK